MIEARPYQREAVKKILERWQVGGITRQLVSLPTGCGKTIIFGMIAEAVRGRTLVLAHREELLTQAAAKIRLVYPDADIGILKAEERGGLSAEVCVASIQTAARHIQELAERNYKLLICDEAHHAVSPSYMRVFNELGFMSEWTGKLLLGVTATAYRGDKAGLGNVFQEIVFERSVLAMMKAGYLCDVRGLEVRTEADISNVHTRTGDFAVDELNEAINTEDRNRLIAEAYLKHGEGRRGVAFCVSVAHAQDLSRAFCLSGVPCAAVWGSMPTDDRRDVLRRYEAGELQILTNCAVLTEGWDVPDTDIIIMARPTKSRGLYVQCVGRGLRVAPGKADCLLLDFVDVARRHKLCNFGTLAGGKPVKPGQKRTLLEAVEKAERIEEQAKKRALHFATDAQAVRLFERSRFVWLKVAGHYKLELGDNSALWCRKIGGGYSPLWVASSNESELLSDDVLPLDYAIGVCEDKARMISAARSARRDAPWRGYPATEKQIYTLRKLGIEFDDGITRGEASELLSDALGEEATDRQRWFIEKHALHSHPELLTKREAGQIIERFKGAHVA